MEETKEAWERIFAGLKSGGEVITPARRTALVRYARKLDLWASCENEAVLLTVLKEAAPAVGVAVESVYASRGYRPPAQGPFRLKPPRLTEVERLQASETGESIALLARGGLGVQEFREELLAGAVLNSASAERFIHSFAVMTLSPERARKEGLRLNGHRASRFGPQKSHYVLPLPEGEYLIVMRLGIRFWSGNEENGPRDLTLDVPAWPGSDLPWSEVTWRRHGGESAPIRYLPGSIFSKLWARAEHLALATWWSQSDAAWFILTDVVPPPPTVDLTMHHRPGPLICQGRIEMVIPPWTTRATVGETYRLARHYMYGARPRALKAASLQRYGFVRAKWGLTPTAAQLKEAAEAWARQKRVTGRARTTLLRNFARDFERTKDIILKPHYAMGRSRASVVEERHLRKMLRTESDPDERKRLMDRLGRVLREANRLSQGAHK